MTKNNKLNTLFNTNFVIFTLLCVVIVLILSNSLTYTIAFSEGLNVWAKRLVPTLLPFMIITKLLINTGIPDKIASKLSGLTSKMFGVPAQASYVLILSFISGYPMGAKLTGDMYSCGHITKQDAHRMLSFVSVSGPIFIISTVAIGMFNNVYIGIIILVSHILGAIVNGLIFKKYKSAHAQSTMSQQAPTQQNIILDSIQSILIVGLYVAIFYMISEVFNSSHLFNYVVNLVAKGTHIDVCTIRGIFNGFIEITHGCLDLANSNLSSGTIAVLATGIISFGGVSTLMQGHAFVKQCGVSVKYYTLVKFTHALFSTIIAILLVLLI